MMPSTEVLARTFGGMNNITHIEGSKFRNDSNGQPVHMQ